MKKLLLYFTILLLSENLLAQTITKESGWLESAFVEWSPVVGADNYNVYYTGGGQTNIKIDTQLIRSYGTYFRADVPGLTAGSYTLTIKPVTANVEGTGTTTGSLIVLAQDRNGFAFDGGRVPGGYKMDGTPKSNAIILYITKNTKNTITFDVITGSNGTTKTNYIGFQNILYGIKKGYDTRPYIFRLIGNITDMSIMEGGDIVIENKNNANSYVTLEGVGNDAVANGWGVRLKTASNIEISNIAVMNCNSTAGDNVGMQQDNDHIWVHNCDLFYGDAGSDKDQVKGDGALDNKTSTYVTIAYNHFWDSGKASLLGLNEDTTTGLYITYHHNWFDHSDSRHPRVRFYSAHIYNNYFDGNAKYGAGSTLGSSLFIEGNFFRNCKYPMLTSKQGTDINGGSIGTFSGEAGGTIKAFNNTMTGQTRYIPYNATTYPVEFDAIEAATRGEVISSSIKSKLGGNTYNNFDTDATLYVKSLTIDTPLEAKDKVMLYAGRVSGGDLKWTFDNAVDDTSDFVITALKSTLTNYTSTMVAIQGETATPGNQTLIASTNNNNQTVSTGNPISNIVFTWGGDATDASATGLPNGVITTKNATAKTLTLSGTPTETMDYTVTTTGTSGSSASDSGTITVLAPSSQVLTTTTNNNQTLVKGTAITTIVLTWSGDATDADVTGLPTGLSAVKDVVAKTITISGTPTTAGTFTFTAITTGSTGTPVAVSGTITVSNPVSGDEIHNFTISGTTKTFYTIVGSMNSKTVTPVNYDGVTLTKNLKIESGTSITYTTTAVSTLTLVIDLPTGKINVNGIPYTAVGGIVTVNSVPVGQSTITKVDSGNLYYIKTHYTTSLGLSDNAKAPKLALYPNPVTNDLHIPSSSQKIEKVVIYTLTGAIVKSINNEVETIDMSNLSTGTYLVKVTTDQGTFTQKIAKK